jgi:hypothetical protein
MGKRTFILRISAAWVAVFVLLLGAPVLAETTSCIFKDGLTRGNWTLEKDAGGGEWPAPNAGLYDYKYRLTVPPSPPSPFPLLPAGTIPSVDFLIPACTPSLDITGAGVTVYSAGNPPGVGARFGSWTGHDQVVRVKGVLLSPRVYTIQFSTSAVLPLRDVSAGLVTSGVTATPYTCKDIVAPVCPGASTPSAGGPLATELLSFSLGSPYEGDDDFRDCKMDVTFNKDATTKSVVTRSILNPTSKDPATTCYEVLQPESLRKTVVCDKNYYFAEGGTFRWDGWYATGYPPGANCITWSSGSSNYSCNNVPNGITHTYSCSYDYSLYKYICDSNQALTGCTFISGTQYQCDTYPNPLDACNITNGGWYDYSIYCNTTAAPPNSCQGRLPGEPYGTFHCSLSEPPPGCTTAECYPSNCAPRTAVSASGITKSDDNSKYCWNDTAGTQHCKTCTVVNGVTRCITQ